MNLTYNQFNLLTFFERSEEKNYTQRVLSKSISVSLGLVNKLLNELLDNDSLTLSDMGIYQITQMGLDRLEPYRVKHAIIFAAGFGERLLPLTLETHKSLLMINGNRIINSVLSALTNIGINDITIVRGHLKEQFEILKVTYPNLKFIDNPIYATSKNMSSAYLVRGSFDQSYVIEGDILLRNPHLLKKYEYQTHFKAIEVDRSETWCFSLAGSKIKDYTLGGENVHESAGISFWTAEDASVLAQDIETAYNSPGGKERFWDDVPLTLFKDHYDIAVVDCNASDLVEIRSIEQLTELQEQ